MMSRAPCAAPVGWKMPKPPRSDGLVVAAEAVGEAGARADVVAVGLDQRPRRRRPDRPSACDRARPRPGGSSAAICAFGTMWWPPSVGDEVREDVVAVDERADDLVAQAEERGELRPDLPVVLEEHAPSRSRTCPSACCRACCAARRTVFGSPSRKSANELPGRKPGEVVLPLRIVRAGRVAILGVVARVDAAELDRVRALQPRRAAAQRKGRLAQIAERVLPLVLDARRPVRRGELELREAGRRVAPAAARRCPSSDPTSPATKRLLRSRLSTL